MSKRWDEMDDVELLQMEAEMQGDLDDLRTAATVYAERTWARGAHAAGRTPAPRRGWMMWTAAGLTAAVSLTVGSVRMMRRAETPGGASGAVATEVEKSSAASDEALLDQIHSDLSSGVPAAMEPLEASTDAHAQRSAISGTGSAVKQ